MVGRWSCVAYIYPFDPLHLHRFPGHWPLALAILDNVLMQRLEPDIITYSAAMSACEERHELGPKRCGFD